MILCTMAQHNPDRTAGSDRLEGERGGRPAGVPSGLRERLAALAARVVALFEPPEEFVTEEPDGTTVVAVPGDEHPGYAVIPPEENGESAASRTE